MTFALYFKEDDFGELLVAATILSTGVAALWIHAWGAVA
jgi:hypothetical protein